MNDDLKIRQSSDKDQDLYYHQESDKIAIRKSDLVIYFRDFKDAVLKAPSLEGIILIVSIWLPIFTADFHGFLGFDKQSVFGFYLALIGLISCFIILKWLGYSIRPLVGLLLGLNCVKQLLPNLENWVEQGENNPDKKVDEIRSKSNKRTNE